MKTSEQSSRLNNKQRRDDEANKQIKLLDSKLNSLNKAEFDQYEYDRLTFLMSIVEENNYKYLENNKTLFINLENKFTQKLSTYNKDLTVCNSSVNDNTTYNKLMTRNIEFFKIFKKYEKTFNLLYTQPKRISFYDDEIKNSSTDSLINQNISSLSQPNKKMLEDLYFVFLPLSYSIYKQSYNKQYKNSSFVCGIQAHQGCGKTTMTGILKFLLKEIYELNTQILSIDDLYSTYEELSNLKTKDKRFKYRGPPGTHDIKYAMDIMTNIKGLKTGFVMPRYDKSAFKGLGDRSPNGELVTKPIDVLLFEGWFLGAFPIEENHNLDQFQQVITNHLKEYQSLWDQVDKWIILKPSKLKYSRMWRAQAEKKNKQGMNWKQMQDFLDYFWYTVPPHLYFPDIEKRRNPLIITIDKYRNYYI